MKHPIIAAAILVTSLGLHAQTNIATTSNSRSSESFLYVKPYIGFSLNTWWGNSPVWQAEQVKTDYHTAEWDSYADNMSLNNAPASVRILPGYSGGAVMGLKFKQSRKRHRAIEFGFEYNSRNYEVTREYDNGNTIGEYVLEGRESKLVVRGNYLYQYKRFGIGAGLWFRYSNTSDRTITFNAYNSSNRALSYTTEIYPYTGNSPYTWPEYWVDRSYSIGVSFFMYYEVLDYMQIFASYEPSNIVTTDYVNPGLALHFSFLPSNYIGTDSFTLGLAFPLDLL